MSVVKKRIVRKKQTITETEMRKIVKDNKDKVNYFMKNLPFDMTNYILEFLADKNGIQEQAKCIFNKFISLPQTIKCYNKRFYLMDKVSDNWMNEYEYAVRYMLINNGRIDRTEQVWFNNYETDDGRPTDMELIIKNNGRTYGVGFYDRDDIKTRAEEFLFEDNEYDGMKYLDTFVIRNYLNEKRNIKLSIDQIEYLQREDEGITIIMTLIKNEDDFLEFLLDYDIYNLWNLSNGGEGESDLNLLSKIGWTELYADMIEV